MRAAPYEPLFGLAPGGVYRATNCCQSRGALLPHPFTLTRSCEQAIGGLLSVALVAEVALAGRYPAPCLRGARTFLPLSVSRRDYDKAAVVWPTPRRIIGTLLLLVQTLAWAIYHLYQSNRVFAQKSFITLIIKHQLIQHIFLETINFSRDCSRFFRG